MNIQRFKEHLPDLMLTAENDAPFSALHMEVGGMTAPRVAKTINFACRCMEPGDVYLEIGTYTGFTLLSASYRNNATTIGVDDFSLKDCIKPERMVEGRQAIKDLLKINLNRPALNGTRLVLDCDFREARLNADSKIAVFFIDGEHDYKNVDDALKWAEPYLADTALVILDDVNMPGVYKRMAEGMASGEFQLLFYCLGEMDAKDKEVNSGVSMDEKVANGIAILEKRKGA